MARKVEHKMLTSAKTSKNDEFYTQLTDIERELKHYKKHFKDKVVYCNCDDPRISNFFHYFSYNFEKLGLKKLITTCYKNQNRDLFSKNDSERAIYLEDEITKLMMDDDVTNKKGIYSYVLTRKEKHLNIRSFTASQKREAYEKQQGICPVCKEKFKLEEMEADHITPWHDGGKSSSENCQLLCKEDNRRKSGK